jgi:GT2 family glycosyltransferase
MSFINYHKCIMFKTCTYLSQRLGFLLRHPQEFTGFLARAMAIYRSQGWEGIQQGLQRDQKGMAEEDLPDNSSRDYQQWLATEPRSRSRHADNLNGAAPFFTVLVNTTSSADDDSINATINSIIDQSYASWELFVVQLSPSIRTPSSRERAAAQQRIHYITESRDQTPPPSFTDLLAMAAGSYLIPLECDGILAQHALSDFAGQLANRNALLCYSDHDHLEGLHTRTAPYFKPDWNPLLLLTQNYIGPLAALKTSALKNSPALPHRLDGHLIWELALQTAATAKTEQVIHLVKILFHLRTARARPLPDEDGSEHSVAAMERTITQHLPQLGYHGVRIVRTAQGTMRLCAPLPDPPPKVSIIIPTRNAQDILKRCVDSVFQKTTYPNFEIIIVDNQSDDPGLHRYFTSLSARDDVKLLTYDAPFNYSALNNFAAQQCQGEILCFLNNDVEVITTDWLTELVGHALRPEHGAVGAMLYYPNDRIQHGGIIIGHSTNGPGGVAANAFSGLPRGFTGQGGRLLHAQYVSAVTGACLAIRHAIFDSVGGFDEEKLAVAYNDVDLCLRLREKGYYTVFTPFAELYHHESASRGRDTSDTSQARFSREIATMHRRWGNRLRHDPSFPSGDLGISQWR